MAKSNSLKSMHWIFIGDKIKFYAKKTKELGLDKAHRLIIKDYGKTQGELIFNGLLIFLIFGNKTYQS